MDSVTRRILCVDDDANTLGGYQRALRGRFSIDTALDGKSALALIASEGAYAVIVADMSMPAMDGIQFLIHARELAPDSVRIMLTGSSAQETAVAAINQGHISQFLTKPCP